MIHTPDAWIESEANGAIPDEDGPRPELDPSEFICPKCDQFSFLSEVGPEGLCVNCSDVCQSGDARDPAYDPRHNWTLYGSAGGTDFFKCRKCGKESQS